jgi:DNA-binding protein HU
MKAKQDIYESMAVELGLTKKGAKEAVDHVFNEIAKYLAEGEKVRIDNFGIFEVRNRAERKGRNPQTGQPLTIKASKNPAFKAGKHLKDKVNA